MVLDCEGEGLAANQVERGAACGMWGGSGLRRLDLRLADAGVGAAVQGRFVGMTSELERRTAYWPIFQGESISQHAGNGLFTYFPASSVLF